MSKTVKDLTAGTVGGIAQVLGSSLIHSVRMNFLSRAGSGWSTVRHRQSGRSDHPDSANQAHPMSRECKRRPKGHTQACLTAQEGSSRMRGRSPFTRSETSEDLPFPHSCPIQGNANTPSWYRCLCVYPIRRSRIYQALLRPSEPSSG